MSSPKKSDTKSVEQMEDVDDEPMEVASLATGDPMNVDSPPPVQPESEDTSSSGRTGDSMAIEGATASTGSKKPEVESAAAERVPDESTESSASMQSDLKDPKSSSGLEGFSPSGGSDASSCPQSVPREKTSPETGASAPSGSTEQSDSTQRPVSLVGIGESVQTVPTSASSPQSHLQGLGSPPKPGMAATLASIGRKILKRSPFKGSSSEKKRAESSSGDENVVSPKSKGKTPKRGSKLLEILSPSKSKTLSPEGGRTSGSQGESPVVEGKPNWFQRIRGSGRDGKGDQMAPPGPSLHEDQEASEGAQLTEIPIAPAESGKGKSSIFGWMKKSKSQTTPREEDTEQYLVMQSPKPSREDMSDSTVTLSLSPLSERRESEFSVDFEAKFQIRPVDEQNISVDTGLASPSEATAASSGTTSGEASVSPPEMDTEEAAESGLASDASVSQLATGSGTTSGETSAAQPAINAMETDSGLSSAGPSVAQPSVDTEESKEPGVISEAPQTTQPEMDIEASESEGTSGESSVSQPMVDTKASESTPEEPSRARAGMEREEADDRVPPDGMPQRRRDPGKLEEEALLSPSKRPKTE